MAANSGHSAVTGFLFRPLQTSLASCSSVSELNTYAPPSVLSSIFDPDSVGGHLSMYEDEASGMDDDEDLDVDALMLSKDFEDEDLAEIDMESFCREDIHNLLRNKNRSSSCALVTSSIYRPETLFSPVPDVNIVHHHLSQDSLDMSSYPNGTTSDFVLTCKAHKDNYTIAFEGSFICSESSYYAAGAGMGREGPDALDQRKRELLEELEQKKAALKMTASMHSNLTTWSKLNHKSHNSANLHRFLVDSDEFSANRRVSGRVKCWEEKRVMGSSMDSSGALAEGHDFQNLSSVGLRKTKSLSNLRVDKITLIPPKLTEVVPKTGRVPRSKLNVSQVIMDNMDEDSVSSPVYEENKLRSLLPNCAIPHHESHHRPQTKSNNPQRATDSGPRVSPNDCASTTTNTTTTSNNNPVQAPSFNLVKLFIKQKSNSTDTCMDVSSGCWPSDNDSSQSFDQRQQQNGNQLVNVNIHNRNYLQEDENEADSLDPLVNNNNGSKSPQKLRNGEEPKKRTSRETERNNPLLESNNNLINNLINNNHFNESSQDHQLTQIYNNIRNTKQPQMMRKNTSLRRLQMETVTRSMQTSIPKLITSATQYASKVAAAAAITSSRNFGLEDGEAGPMTGLNQRRVKIVPSSFLKKLHKNGERRGEGGTAPVYVIYPSYTLPNLDFVNKHEVILSPIDYKEPFMGVSGGPIKSGAIAKVRMRKEQRVGVTATNSPPHQVNTRPKSFSDAFGSKRTKFDYKNICDWRSLIVLLPIEYSRILRSIPDIDKEIGDLQEDLDDGFGEEEDDIPLNTSQSQKQMFCQTTPMMRRKLARPLSCDCAAYVMQTSSSSSSSNQPASSGYRGSSTILTDSFEYAELSDDIANTTGLPPTHCGRTPKGILRRNFNRSRLKMQQQQGKRNSMFEGTGQKVVDKRRSLQEFPTQQYFDNIQMAGGGADFEKTLSPLLNYRQIGSGELGGTGENEGESSMFRNKLSSELEALEMELLETQHMHTPTMAGDGRLTSEGVDAPYDRLKLRDDVSRVLRNRPKRVSFSESNSESTTEAESCRTVVKGVGSVATEKETSRPELQVPPLNGEIAFETPPNSPNISVMAQQRIKKSEKQSEQERIQSNRFKRLQIQWELLSKDSDSLLKEMNEIIPVKMETKSGGSTPTSGPPQRISRIPRPISYPATRTQEATATKGRLWGRASTTSTTPISNTKKVGQQATSSPTTQRAPNKIGSIKKGNTTRFIPKAR